MRSFFSILVALVLVSVSGCATSPRPVGTLLTAAQDWPSAPHVSSRAASRGYVRVR